MDTRKERAGSGRDQRVYGRYGGLVSQNRNPRRFAVYRVMAADSSFFVSNHVTEEGAKHAAACRQACAPEGISYVVDPPDGPLSSLEPKGGFPAVLRRLSRRT
jgi:hypothetical protein